MKILYFDVETTGLIPDIHDIVQFAYIVEIDGEIVSEKSFKIRPQNLDKITPEAMQVNGFTLEELLAAPTFKHCKAEWEADWARFVNKFDKADKFTPCAYNGRFDIDFLKAAYLRSGDMFFGSWLNYRLLDPLAVTRFLQYTGVIAETSNHKLETVARLFGIPIKAHDAGSDIAATRAILQHLSQYVKVE